MKSFIFFTFVSLTAAYAAFAGEEATDAHDASEGTARPSQALQITPYLWATGLKGEISPFRRGPAMTIDKSFSDVMDDLNFGGFINIWGRSDRFVVSGDIMYVDTTGSHGAGPLPAFQIPGLGTIPTGANVKADVDTLEFMATLQGGYRVLEAPWFTFDALGGARFWHISNDISVTADHPLLGRTSASYEESFNWIDPVVGVRLHFFLTDKLSLQTQADIGGFGVGSDLTWSALATVNYIVSDRFSVSGGYKVLDVDYDHDGHLFDARLSGPVLGLTYRF